MGRHQNKPWQKRWVPQPGPRVQDPAWTAPATPEGWERHPRRDYVEFTYGENLFAFDRWRIIGRVGCKWRVYRTENIFAVHDEVEYGERLRFEGTSLDACLVFVKIEQSNEDEKPKSPWSGFDVAVRNSSKAVLQGVLYGRSAAKFSQSFSVKTDEANKQLEAYREYFGGKLFTTVVIDGSAKMDLSALEERVIKNAK